MSIQTKTKRIALAASIGLSSALPLSAADLTWDGGPSGTGTDINTAANWSTDVLPGGTDNVHFGNTGPTNPVMSGPLTWNKLIFDPGGPSYNFNGTGQTLTLVNNQPVTIIENQSSQQQVITVGTAGFAGTIDTGTVNGGDIVLNAALNVGNSSAAGNRYVGIAGSHNIYFNVDTAINAAGIVTGGAWTSSTTSGMHRRARGRFSMANFSGTAYMGDIGTSYLGSFHLDSTSNGTMRLTHNNSLGGTSAGAAVQIYGGTTGNATLELAGNISVARGSVWMDGRSGAVADDPHFLNVSGNNTFNVVADFGAGVESPITTNSDGVFPQTNAGNWNIQSDAGKLTFTGGPVYNFFQTGVTPVPITMQLRGAGDGQIDNQITLASPSVPSIDIVKSGTGTWTLTNSTNDYTGTTTITGGTLSLGTTGTIAGSTVIDVQSGGTFRVADLTATSGVYTLGTNANPALNQVLKGSGTVAGGIVANTNTIAPGVTGAGTGSLTINGDLTLNGSSTLAIELTNNPLGTNDILVVNGNLNLNGTNTVAVTKLNGLLGSGSYSLIDYSGSLIGSPSFTLTGVGAGTTRQSFNVVDDNVNTIIKLNVVGNAANLTWVGNGTTNIWDVVGATNWSGAVDQQFFDGDNVTFSNTGSNSPAINISGTVNPSQVTFSNSSTHNYAFTGGIINAQSIASTGSGSVTFNNSDIIANDVTLSSSSSIAFQSSGNTTINNALTSTSSGNITISNGSFSTVGNFTNGGTGNVTINNAAFSIGGTLAQSGSGTTTIGGSGTIAIGAVTVSGGGTVAYTRAGDETISATLSGNGSFRKQVETGTTTLSGANGAFTGNIFVDTGTLKLGSTTALGSVTAMTTVANGAAVDLNGQNSATTANVTIQGSGIGGTGALTNTSTTAFAHINGLTLANDATMSVGFEGAPSRAITFISNYLHGQGNDLNVNFIGHTQHEINWINVGETNLANINISTTVPGAALYIGGTTTLGSNPGTVTVSNGAKMAFYVKDPSISHTKPIVIDATGGGLETDMQNNNLSALGNHTVASPIMLNGDATISQYNPTTLGTRSFTLSGKISGTGSLGIHASTTNANRLGVIQLTSDLNDYTGPTVISGGFGVGASEVSPVNDRVVLSIGDGGTTGKLGPADVTINSAGILRFNRSNAFTVANNIIGPGNVENTGVGGVASLSGTNTYTGTTTVNAGTLKFAQQVALYNNATAAPWDDAHIIVNSGGTAAFNVGGVGEFTSADIQVLSALGSPTGGFRPGSSIGFDTTNAGGTFTYSNLIADTNAGANSIGVAKLGTGTLVLSATNTYTGNTTVSAGTLNITGDHTTGANYNVASGANLITKNVRATSNLTVNGTATINANGGLSGASKVETFTIGTGGKLNLKDNDFVVGTAADVTAVRTAIKTGVAGSAGITSDLPAFGVTTGFGYAMGNDAALSPLLAGSLTGQTYDADSVLVKYTFLGDADLDGDSDLNDLGLWAQSFTGDLGNPAIPATFWTSGDFDYDGDTDLNDLGFWAGTFTGDLGGGAGSLIVVAPGAPAGAISALNSMGITVVPEPSTFVLAGVGLAGVAIASRRKRRA